MPKGVVSRFCRQAAQAARTASISEDQLARDDVAATVEAAARRQFGVDNFEALGLGPAWQVLESLDQSAGAKDSWKLPSLPADWLGEGMRAPDWTHSIHVASLLHRQPDPVTNIFTSSACMQHPCERVCACWCVEVITRAATAHALCAHIHSALSH